MINFYSIEFLSISFVLSLKFSLQFRKYFKVRLMKLPRGFGKNYFSLNAITATVNQVSLDAITTRVHNFHILSFDTDELESELEEEELATLCPLQLSTKPCHCNCYFFRFTRKTLSLHYFQNYFFNYFKMLNNSISPP